MYENSVVVWLRERKVGDYYTSWELIDVHSSKRSADQAVKDDSGEWRDQRVISTTVLTLPERDESPLEDFRGTEQYENLPDEIKALLDAGADEHYDRAGTVRDGKIDEWQI